MQEFEFDELTFVYRSRFSDCDLSRQTRLDMKLMLKAYPELGHWSLLALSSAWGMYSQDIYTTGWMSGAFGERDDGFLGYCYVRTRWPECNFSSGEWCRTQLDRIGRDRPWQQSPLPDKPDWVTLS